MNREILFRGKRIDNGEWVEGYLRFGPDMKDAYIGCFMDYIDEGLHTDYFEFRVFSVTIGQYTGLIDKNGKKIFEGDIVRYGHTLHHVVFEKRAGNAYFGIVMDAKETWDFCPSVPSNRMMIVGNIHDNPELLEGE